MHCSSWPGRRPARRPFRSSRFACGRCSRTWRPSCDATLLVDCPEGLCALGQCELIEEIVSNLASNAVKHGASGEIVLRARRDSSGVTIEVLDSGPGIRLEQRDRLFDRFYRGGTTETDGFGLGLAIVREAVVALGGRIEIVGRPGGGTTARVTLESQVVRAA